MYFKNLFLSLFLVVTVCQGASLGEPKPSPKPFTEMAPNGHSDMLNLFKYPDQWVNARKNINVFHFYAVHMQCKTKSEACKSVGDNVLNNFIAVGAPQKLRDWNIGVSIGSASIKPWPNSCKAIDGFNYTRSAMKNALAAGFNVVSIQTDEPAAAGSISWEEGMGNIPRPNNFTDCSVLGLEETAKRHADYMKMVNAAYPTVQQFDIEPYGVRYADWHIQWLTYLLKNLEGSGITMQYYKIDFDTVRVRRELQKKHGIRWKEYLQKDFLKLDTFLRQRNMTLMFTFFGPHTETNKEFFQFVLGTANEIKPILNPKAVSFQSWEKDGGEPYGVGRMPDNVPETDYSMTQIVNDILAFLMEPVQRDCVSPRIPCN